MRRASLRLRLLLSAGVFSLTAMLLAAVGLSWLFERHVSQWADAELTAHMERLIAGIDRGADGKLAVVRTPGDPRFETPLSGLYWEAMIEPSGSVFRSRSLWDFQIALPPETPVADTLQHYRVRGPGDSELYLVQKHVQLPPRLGNEDARVAVALDASQLRAAVWNFAKALVPFLLLLAVLLTFAAWGQVTVGLKPLAAIRDKLAAVATGRAPRLGDGLPSEVQPLADEMDALLAARERQIEKARGRAADLAHGLKTPLQVLAGDIKRLAEKGEGEIALELEKVSAAMQRHVDRELARARMAAADVNATAHVASIAGSVVRVVRRTPQGERLTWEVEVASDLKAHIDPTDLAEALGNLVENAARHAVSSVSVQAVGKPGKVAIIVNDDGPGIPEALREDVLRRGRRLDTSSAGAGLGLSIVSDIADTWSGNLDFGGKPGSGFDVTLTLPRAS